MKDPFVGEKFTKAHSFARKLAREYFEKYPKDRYQTEIESWRKQSIRQYRIYDEAAAGAEGLMPWSARFDEPIVLPNGKKLFTRAEQSR